jgi:hypothetical protein
MFVNRKLGIVPADLNIIPTDSFDFVLAIDLIEHLTKDQGYLLLYEIDRISKGSSGLLTPNGFAWQPPSENNSYNAHISGWSHKEFNQLGWKINRGQIGFRKLYGPYAIQKYKGKSHLILEIILLFFPYPFACLVSISSTFYVQIFCTKLISAAFSTYRNDRLNNLVFLSPSLCTQRSILSGQGNSTDLMFMNAKRPELT